MITVPDTNLVWAIIDSEDSHHEDAIKFIQTRKIGEICVLPAVLIEFRQRYNSELNQLISRINNVIDAQKDETLTLEKVNLLIEQVSKKLSDEAKLDKSKLNRYVKDLHKICREKFMSKQSLSRVEIKGALTSLGNTVDCRADGALILLVNTGYYAPIESEREKEMMNRIIDQGIKFDGVVDSVIAGELLLVSESNNKEYFEFATFDKDFSIKLNDTIQKFNMSNLNVNDLMNPSKAK